MRKNNFSGRALPSGIDHAMPWRSFIRSVHYKTYRPGRITFAENFSELYICHNRATGNLANDLVDPFAIIGTDLFTRCHDVVGTLRKIARAGAPSPLPAASL